MKNNLFKDTFKTVFMWVSLLQFLIIFCSIVFIFKPFLDTKISTISTQILETTQGISHNHFQLIHANNITTYQQSWLPFNLLLSRYIKDNNAIQNTIYYHPTNPSLYFVSIKTNNQSILISFPHKIIGTQPTLTFILFFFFLILSSFIVAWVIANKQKKVFQNLAEQALQIGKGHFQLENKQFDIVEIQQLFDTIKKMSLDLLKAQQEKTVMLAGISHDLRTPITRLYLQLAINEKHIPQTLLKNIEEELKQIETMIDLFIDQSQVDYQINLCTENINCQNWLTQLIDKYQNKRLTLTNNDDINLTTNTVVLERIIQNIVDNALKHTDKNVEIGYQQTSNATHFTITDFGDGFKQDELNNLKQSFVQANTSDEGFGLGLSIVHYLSKQQGWEVQYKNHPKESLGLKVQLTIPKSQSGK